MNANLVGFDAENAILSEWIGRVRDETSRAQNICNDHRFEDVQFEMTIRTSDSDGRVVAHHLSSDLFETKQI